MPTLEHQLEPLDHSDHTDESNWNDNVESVLKKYL